MRFYSDVSCILSLSFFLVSRAFLDDYYRPILFTKGYIVRLLIRASPQRRTEYPPINVLLGSFSKFATLLQFPPSSRSSLVRVVHNRLVQRHREIIQHPVHRWNLARWRNVTTVMQSWCSETPKRLAHAAGTHCWHPRETAPLHRCFSPRHTKFTPSERNTGHWVVPGKKKSNCDPNERISRAPADHGLSDGCFWHESLLVFEQITG